MLSLPKTLALWAGEFIGRSGRAQILRQIEPPCYQRQSAKASPALSRLVSQLEIRGLSLSALAADPVTCYAERLAGKTLECQNGESSTAARTAIPGFWAGSPKTATRSSSTNPTLLPGAVSHTSN